MNRARDVSVAAALVALVLVLYRKVLRLWWTYDDAYTIHLAVDHPIGDAFTSGALWPQKLFTPLLVAAYEANWAAFGLQPAAWYAVQLALASLTAVAFYAALRLWFARPGAAAGAALFVLAVPLCSITMQLSCVHYFLAMLLGSLATIAYVAALRGSSYALTLLSAAVYLAAMLAKETVVPLVAVLLVVPERNARTRGIYIIPHAVAVIGYFAWRRAVIGTTLGGYGWATSPSDWPSLALSLPMKLFLGNAGHDLAVGAIAIAVMAIGVVLAIRHIRGAAIFVVAVSLAAATVLPVSKEMQRRYALMPWICWTVAFVAGAEMLRRRNRGAGVALLLAAPMLMAVANRQEWSAEYARTMRM